MNTATEDLDADADADADDFQMTEEDFKGTDEVTRVYQEVHQQQNNNSTNNDNEDESYRETNGDNEGSEPNTMDHEDSNCTNTSTATSNVHSTTATNNNTYGESLAAAAVLTGSIPIPDHPSTATTSTASTTSTGNPPKTNSATTAGTTTVTTANNSPEKAVAEAKTSSSSSSSASSTSTPSKPKQKHHQEQQSKAKKARRNPTTTPKTNSSNSTKFYALRKGKNTRNCIYFNWKDIYPQLQFNSGPNEYQVFDSWLAAANYINTNRDDEDDLVEVWTEDVTKPRKSKTATSSSSSSAKKKATQNSASKVKVSKSPKQPESKVGISVYNTHSFDHMYESLKMYYEEEGNSNVPIGTMLGDWVHEQQTQYFNGKLAEDQVERLKKLDFYLPDRNDVGGLSEQLLSSATSSVVAKAATAAATNTETTTNRVIGKKVPFDQRVEEWVKYLQIHNGNEPPFASELYKWAAGARKRYRDHQLDDKKRKKLEEIGFRFWVRQRKSMPKDDGKCLDEERPWDEMFAELLQYKDANGDCNVPSTINTPLRIWTDKQRNDYQRKEAYLFDKPEGGGPTKADRLANIGFAFQRRRGRKKGKVMQDDASWQVMYEEMKKFKAENGHCMVTITNPKTELRKWFEKQRKHYKSIRANEPSDLTPMRIQLLNDIDFPFEATVVLKKWDERYDELVEFKKKFGHVKVPRMYQGLGKWVADQRQKYSLMRQGKKTSMTEERVQKLTDLGMIWAVFKLAPVEQRAERKPWEYRYQQLIRFKEENGHTIVPQHFPVLGQWVHTQRVNYKLLKQNRKTLMTPEQALKLSDIGFTFEVMPRKQGHAVKQCLGNPYPHLPLIETGTAYTQDENDGTEGDGTASEMSDSATDTQGMYTRHTHGGRVYTKEDAYAHHFASRMM